MKSSKVPCLLADPVALRQHLNSCPACRADRQRLIDFAIEILLSASDATTSDRLASTIVVINHQTTSADSGSVAKTTSPVFRDFVAARFLPDVTRHLKISGRKNYGYILQKHVMLVIGDYRLEDITFEMIQDGLVQKMLDAGYAVQTVRHVRNVTNSVFNHALRTRSCV